MREDNAVMKSHPTRPAAARPVPQGLTSLTLLLALCSAGPAAAVQALGCLIEPERVVDVGSPVTAVIDRVEVERGQVVKQGQVLAVLRAAIERAAFDAASLRADAIADVQAAASNAKFNRDRLQRAEDLFRQSFISQQALDQARTEAQMAEQKLSQAREQQLISQQDRGVAAATLQQRTIRSPMDGVVAERFMSAGERADDKPLLRIVRIDPLRVQLVVPVSLYGAVKIDSRVSVMPELPGAKAVVASVSMVDRVIDPASNTFRVQLSLPNPDLALPAGLRCSADLGTLQPAPAAGLAAAPATPPTVAAPSPWAGRTNQVVVASAPALATGPWAGRTNQVVVAAAPAPATGPWAGRTNQGVSAPVAAVNAGPVPTVQAAAAPAPAELHAAAPSTLAQAAILPAAAGR